MKKLILILLLANKLFPSQAQILSPCGEWFELEDFFEESSISKNKIRSIRMELSEKKDDHIFVDKGELLNYTFDRNGNLIKAMKRIPQSSGFDTSQTTYSYTSNQKIKHIDERSGPFHFVYEFHYANDSSFLSLKLIPKTNGFDTLYRRRHHLYAYGQLHKEVIENRIGKAFLEKRRSYDEKSGLLIEEKLIYLLNRNEIKTTYIYEGDQLVGKQHDKNFGFKNNRLWKYDYANGQYELIQLYKEGNLVEKVGFTYEGTLPKAVIVRNIQEKYVRIYKCYYSFF